jgi:hypothetical protein
MPFGRKGAKWVAAAYQIRLVSHGGPCRRNHRKRDCRHRCPRVAQDVVAVMQICAGTGTIRTSQIDVLAYNARGAASHWLRNRGPGGVPSVRNRVVLPRLFSLKKAGVDPTDDVDFAIIGVVGHVRKMPAVRHWSTSAPGVTCDIVD